MRRVAVIALVLAACGDDDSGGRTLTVDEIPAKLRAAYCRYLVTCGQFADLNSCSSASLPPLQDGASIVLDPNLIGAIKAGRVHLDTARVSSCLEQLAESSCDRTGRDYRTLGWQCRQYLYGTLGDLATCYVNAECISQHCAQQSSEPCVAGHCFGDTQPPTVRAEIGESCAAGCVYEAYCSQGTCTALLRAGEPCESSSTCDFGLACLGEVGSRSCQALPAVGELCPDDQCRDIGAYCAPSGRCEMTGLEGAICSGTSGFGECAWAYPCDTSTGRCTRAPGVGEQCALDSVVRCFGDGLLCDTTTVTCIEPRRVGDPCTFDAFCASGYCNVYAQRCEDFPSCP